MKTKTTVLALSAVLATVMAAPSFAATEHHAATQARSTPAYSGYYNSAVPEGTYRGFYGPPTTSGNSGAIGGIGR
jgi:hypothetical protein